MADVSSEDISQAYQDVRSDKSDTNWLLLKYQSDKIDTLTLVGTGSQGLEEMKNHVSDSEVMFGYARIVYSNDKESKREKFILVVWIGPSVKVMRRAKVSVHTADVKKVLNAYSIEVAAKEKADLDEEPIVKRLRSAGGASYDGV
ncbi:hypothetical protein BOTBODRAFT_192474 [Botryobasidium botryosum FD-172 SS1]|uniref:ADF-H domain-containing protein n=1 Tax=Botryobasidium botryosum (strain FD-172 SS1) TaxID=930990 RepID=A0A067LYD0_BOTB1|nr:hypothetical protein BOTBODRAFT_192474 [Botryobasidium botryosum FD-172 SS1]